MRKTDINNPDIEVKDKRLLELDNIVSEVKESEEWEAVKMDILDVGVLRGINQGEFKKLIMLISRKKAKSISAADIADFLEEDPDLVQRIYDALDQYDAEKEWPKILTLLRTPKADK